tara:strand:- start:157721 stop:158071 length:351 start_codon:yes stop_codon:yes gene_type:complete
MKKNIEVNKKEGTVTVEISVNKRNYVREPIISLRTKDITILLEKEGIEVESCLQNDSIHNDSRNPKTTGQWVFKLKQTNKKPTKKPPTPKEELSSLTNEDKSDKMVSKTKNIKKRK